MNQILSFQSPITNGAAPLSIRFVVGGVGCFDITNTVVLNGMPQGTFTMGNGCSCIPACETRMVTGNLADFNPTGTNTITIDAGVGFAFQPVGYVQVCIEYLG
jgi:hypothetical protein